MHLILLPGNSKYNKDWIEEVEKKLNDLFDSTHIQYYNHWEGGSGMMINEELQKLEKHAKNYREYVIFAKSAGVFLTLKAIEKDLISPSMCIFTGTASRWDTGRVDVQELLTKMEMPKLFIQQTSDRYMEYAEIERMLKDLNVRNYQCNEVPGSDHGYSDVGVLKDIITKFLTKHEKSFKSKSK